MTYTTFSSKVIIFLILLLGIIVLLKFSSSKVSSTLSPNVLILAEKIETFCSKNTFAISASKPCLSEVSTVIKFLAFSLFID